MTSSTKGKHLKVILEILINNTVETTTKRYSSNRNGYIFSDNLCKEQVETWKKKIVNIEAHIEKLWKTNTLNDTFFIWFDGHFGTINSFRLGRLPSQPVDWNEINAGWGHATKLLDALGKWIGFEFVEWRPIPNGSTSTMLKLEDQTKFELYGSSDISLGRLFWYRRFDTAMIAFLDCVNQLIQFAIKSDITFEKKIPYLFASQYRFSSFCSFF